MSFDRTFCPSPWFHMRINNDGVFDYCRWNKHKGGDAAYSIRTHTAREYFQQEMAKVRAYMLEGTPVAGCGACHEMDQHHKISGRQRQLLKIGVNTQQFVKSLKSSPWIPQFESGSETNLMPQDWQIDLGNYCNSACVFCHPNFSSRLATEWRKIGLIDTMPTSAWCDDPVLLDKFLADLASSSNLRYLHFIGGETLITPAFKVILERLQSLGLHKSAAVGFTTNLTVWDDEIIQLLSQFHQVNLGVSIECFDSLNDYVRWPSRIQQVQIILDRWLELARHQKWYLQLRVTPTVLTIGHLCGVYDYAWQQGIPVESCNFLQRPEYLRPSVLPLRYREPIILSLDRWIQAHTLDDPPTHGPVVNTRNPDFVYHQIRQDAISYLNFLRDQPDESYHLPQMIDYVKKIDASRQLTILDYLPEYEELFRSVGY